MKTARLRRMGVAVVATIVSSLGVVAPAGAEPATGSLVGRITENSGAPATGLLFVSNMDGAVFRYVSPNGGSYQILDLPAGEYTAEFTTSWRGTYRAQPNPVVVAGAATVLDIVLPPVGSLQGRFTGRDGAGIADVTIGIGGGLSARTGADGSWRVDRAFVGDAYRVQFTHFARGINQFAYGKLSYETADPITVRGGETTVVDDALLPTGSIRVTARDSVTGAAIASFSAHAHTRFAQSGGTGELVLTDVPVGTHDLTVSAPGYLRTAVVKVTVVEGQTAQAAVTLTPEARIDVTVTDATTGLPLPDMCVMSFGPSGVLPCADWTDGQGRVSLGRLDAGTYQLFVVQGFTQCECTIYGAQWVGPHGGTGRRISATSITLSAGQTAAAPTVKMDLAGNVTGRVTVPGGQAATGGTVGLIAFPADSGEISYGATPIGGDGSYTLYGAGPYEWPLFFNVDGQAPQFGGGNGNYLFAQTVRVSTAATTSYDFRLRQGVAVTATVSGLGHGTAGSRIVAYNTVTGDFVGFATADGSGRATFPLVGPQFVRFVVNERPHPGTFWIPIQGSKSVNLNFS